MTEWLARNQRAILLSGGVFMILVALALFFWGGESASSDANRLAQANLQRMEAAVTPTSSISKPKPPSAHIEAIYEKRKKQTRYLLLFFAVIGILFVTVGALKRKRD